MAAPHVAQEWGDEGEGQPAKRGNAEPTSARIRRWGVALTTAVACACSALWLAGEGGSRSTRALGELAAAAGSSRTRPHTAKARMSSLMQRDFCCRKTTLAQMPTALALHWRGGCGDSHSPGRDGDPVSPTGEHVLPHFDTWKVCMANDTPPPPPPPLPPPPPPPAPPPTTTPAPPWQCEGLENLHGREGSLTAGITCASACARGLILPPHTHTRYMAHFVRWQGRATTAAGTSIRRARRQST